MLIRAGGVCRVAVLCLLALFLADVPNAAARALRYQGFNVVVVPEHPYGSPSARTSLTAMRRAGADTIAIVLFLWQRDSQHTGVARGDDMPDPALRSAIREAHAQGLRAFVKPQVWVEGSWAGSVEPATDEGWRAWFERYQAAVVDIARVAADEKAEGLVIGTELERTTQRVEWWDMIAAVRAVYPGLLTYAAHNLEEAEAVPFWDDLDAIGVTLYPVLGADQDRDARQAVMRAAADRLDRLAKIHGKPVIVAEIGVRSAAGAAMKPWQSAEERVAAPDPGLQAEILADWLVALDRPAIEGILIWRWFTDPAAGGLADTDFTVQGKPAERVLCLSEQACRD
jgi:hypothetical protein